MQLPSFIPLASIEAMRPVFLIVMGAFLFLSAWRISQHADRWTARAMVSGALMLAFGYMIIRPMYETGHLRTYNEFLSAHPKAATWLAWTVVNMVVMNAGWLLFGAGLALHAGLIRFPARRPVSSTSTVLPVHEPAA